MGEISAKHLRGESMADVIFNGSSARKPLGTASVELVFDNSEGKIGGEYASYNEVALRRSVSRDGTSDYFINGIKVRRKDITQLFLGTGLGTRSYAIIEQGMISRVIEARPDDLRAFLEEAAGISRYKERRRETESRIAQTRENLDRLNDLREEVEKQIRHLQRQAATARRYQVLKEEERKLQAELLALRLQGLDQEAGVRDAASARCETAMQAVIADLREAEAESSRFASTNPPSGRPHAIQARFYAAGADVTRTEQSIQFARELRHASAPRIRRKPRCTSSRRDRSAIGASSRRSPRELATMVPELDRAHDEERAASQAAASAASTRSRPGSWPRTRMPSRSPPGSARHRSSARASSSSRISSIGCCSTGAAGRRARDARATAARGQPRELAEQADVGARCRTKAADRARASCSRSLASRASASANRHRRSTRCAPAGSRRSGCRYPPRLCNRRRSVRFGQSHAVARRLTLDRQAARRAATARRARLGAGRRTVLGSYLEAVCVDGLDSSPSCLGSFDGGHLAVVSVERRGRSESRSRAPAGESAGRAVSGLGAVSVLRAETLDRGASGAGAASRAGESVVTRDGIWLGADWLRLSRDPRAAHRRDRARGDAARRCAPKCAGSRRRSRSASAARAHPRARPRLRGPARPVSDGSQPAAPRTRRSARGARCGASAQGGCRAAAEPARDGTRRRARGTRAHRDGSARGARPHGNRHRRPGRARAAADGAREERERCAGNWPQRAPRRRPRSSVRASWRCRWSRAALARLA